MILISVGTFLFYFISKLMTYRLSNICSNVRVHKLIPIHPMVRKVMPVLFDKVMLVQTIFLCFLNFYRY